MATPQSSQSLQRQGDGDLPSLLGQLCRSNTKKRSCLHNRGTVLFAEGDPARGIYILQTGSAAVSVSSSEGRVIILRIAQAGDVLGLNSVLWNSFYNTTVKTLAPCRIDFMSRAELTDFIERSPDGANILLKLLSRELTQLTERTRSLLLAQTAGARLANLLLECARESARIDKVFTHEEIAQMICSSRETVTRLFTLLRSRNVIQINATSVVICDRGALEHMIEPKSSL
jgi:CRP/FNR family transcriptional regulator, cyclic AMP receptor protein